MELSEKIDASTDVSIRLNIMFSPRLGRTKSIRLANWYDGCGLREGPLGYNYEYTKDIQEYTNSSCRRLVESGRFAQEEVDCYNSLVSNGMFRLDCSLPDGRTYTYLDPVALCNVLKITCSTHNQLELMVWFPTWKIVTFDKDCDDIYVSDLIRQRHRLYRQVNHHHCFIKSIHQVVMKVQTSWREHY